MDERFPQSHLPEYPAENDPAVDSPEFRTRMAERFLRALETDRTFSGLHGKTLEETFDSEESRRTFVENLQLNDFSELLIAVNGILYGMDRSTWGMDGTEVVIGSPDDARWDFPEFEDKKDLLNMSLVAAKEMIAEKRDLKDVGILISSAISGLHLFNDGNGRTAKCLLALINKGSSGAQKETLREVLASTEFSNAVNVSTLQAEASWLIEREIGMRTDEGRLRFSRRRSSEEWAFNDTIPAEKQESFKRAFTRCRIVFQEALFMRAEPKVKLAVDDVGAVELGQIIPTLTEAEIDEIVDTWKRLKKRNVEIIIDCIAHPDKPEYQLRLSNRDGGAEVVSMLDMYKRKIKRYTDAALYQKVFE